MSGVIGTYTSCRFFHILLADVRGDLLTSMSSSSSAEIKSDFWKDHYITLNDSSASNCCKYFIRSLYAWFVIILLKYKILITEGTALFFNFFQYCSFFNMPTIFTISAGCTNKTETTATYQKKHCSFTRWPVDLPPESVILILRSLRIYFTLPPIYWCSRIDFKRFRLFCVRSNGSFITVRSYRPTSCTASADLSRWLPLLCDHFGSSLCVLLIKPSFSRYFLTV